MYSFIPNRQFAHMIIDMDENTFSFENDSNRWITLTPDNEDHIQSIRNVWFLLTTDMRRSKMPIAVKLNGSMYELDYKSGYVIRPKDVEGSEILVGGRPMTHHHLRYCIENQCGYNEARKNISITQETTERWVRGKWYARSRPI